MSVGATVKPSLIVGLGNPGRAYVGTRHNIGFEVVDGLAKSWDCSLRNKLRFSAAVGEVARKERRLVLAKPQTFMNRSGVAVQAMLAWLKLTPGELLVVVDDADLPLGRLRLKPSGGSGGHNGLRSIIEALGGTEEFARLRVGIGRTGAAGADITNHVLSRFGAGEKQAADAAVTDAVAAVEYCVAQGIVAAMDKFNRRKSES